MNVWQKFKGWIAKKMNFTVETSPAMKEESFLEWLGVKRKNKDVMAEVTYFTCLKMMSETLAKIPWKYYQKTDKGIIEPELSDVAKLLKNRPNPFMTPTAFWNAVEMNRNHFGNAYVYVRSKFKRKKYGGEYKVMDLWIMPSNCVQIVVDDEGYFGGRGKIWYVYNDKYSGQQYVFGTDEVLHFKTSHSLDGITGLPVQAILKTTVEGAAASQDYLNSLYESGLTGKATLEYTGDLNKDLKEKLVQAFEEFGSGAKNAGKIIPVPLGMKLTPLDIKLSDSQFIELKKYSALQIAAAFGIKPNQINDYTKSSYSNSEQKESEFSVMICTTTLYSYIDKGIFLHLTNKNLPVKKNKKRTYKKVKKTQARASAGESIEKRPEEIETREEFGHWEMDTVKGKRGKSKNSLLVLTERKTRDEIVMKLPEHTAAAVVNALDAIERKWGDMFKQVFKTITMDNGSEFADCEGIERSALGAGSRTKTYYCHPYSSYERGSNEVTNKMIRRHIPKGTNFDEKTDEEISAIESWVNNYPRKIHDYHSAGELFEEEIRKIS